MKKLSIILLLLFLIGCTQPNEPVPSSPSEPETQEAQTPAEETMETEAPSKVEFDSPEKIAGKLALEHAGEGRIVSLRTKEHNGVPVMEVQIQKKEELLVYLVDPSTKEIESVVTKDQKDEGLTLEEGHFLSREHMEGKTELRGIEVKEDEILYTLKQGKGGKVFRVNKNSKKVDFVKDEPELFELKGKVNIDLFQALQKIEVFLGDVEVKSLAYVPQNEETSAIEAKVYVEEGGEKLLRTLQLDTYSGVIIQQDF